MEHQDLKARTARGLLWGGFGNATQQFLNLFFGIFLARLLSPSDYGMVGMLTVFSSLAIAIQESGFITALVNRKEVRDEDYNAVFWFNIAASAVLYAILFFAAPLIAALFRTPELTALARYSFISILLNSLGCAQSAYLTRNLMIKQKSIATVCGISIAGTVGVYMAANGFSYWGIATQTIVFNAVVNGMWWVMSPWRPSFKIKLKPIAEMFRFSYKVLVTNVFNQINNNLISIILGRFYTRREVGNYSQAWKWNTMGSAVVNGMVSGVSQSVLAQVRDDRERQLRVLRKMVRFTSFVSFPAMLGLSFIAPELITVAITDKWLESAMLLRILCLCGAVLPISFLFSNLILSRGKSTSYMLSTIGLGCVQLVLMLSLHNSGIMTMVKVYTAVSVLWVFVWYLMARYETAYRLRDFILDTCPFIVIAALSMAGAYFITRGIGNIVLLLGAKIITAAVIYVLAMWLSGSATFRESLVYLKKTDKK